MSRKGFQIVSKEMIKTIENTHRFTTVAWTSKFDITTIGFGRKIEKESTLKITRKKARTLLEEDLKTISKGINKLLKKEIPQHHFDVFCHIAYDYNLSAVKNSSLLFRYLDSSLNNEEVSLIMIWTKIKGIHSRAMIYRRQHDIRIFSSKNYEVDMK